jgi:hypothetical protein
MLVAGWSLPASVAISLYLLAAALLVLQAVDFVKAVINDDLPWHDRWAGTEVVTRR